MFLEMVGTVSEHGSSPFYPLAQMRFSNGCRIIVPNRESEMQTEVYLLSSINMLIPTSQPCQIHRVISRDVYQVSLSLVCDGNFFENRLAWASFFGWMSAGGILSPCYEVALERRQWMWMWIGSWRRVKGTSKRTSTMLTCHGLWPTGFSSLKLSGSGRAQFTSKIESWSPLQVASLALPVATANLSGHPPWRSRCY